MARTRIRLASTVAVGLGLLVFAPAASQAATRGLGNVDGQEHDLSVPFSFIFGSLELPTEPVTLRHGHVALTVNCPLTTLGGRCTGVITLVPEGAGTEEAKRARRTGRFQNSIGDKSYAVRAGKRAKVRVRISRDGRRAINRTGSARVKVYLRRTKRANRAKRVGTLEVQTSRHTKRRLPRNA